MFNGGYILIFWIAFATLSANAQEDAIRFFDLEPRPTISILYDQSYKRERAPISIPYNIYSSSNQRRSIDMGQQVQRKQMEKNALSRIYQSRISQQQNRLSQNFRSISKDKNPANTETPSQSERRNYQYRPYGWQNDYYHSSSLWRPTFYQRSSFGQLRANRMMFY